MDKNKAEDKLCRESLNDMIAKDARKTAVIMWDGWVKEMAKVESLQAENERLKKAMERIAKWPYDRIGNTRGIINIAEQAPNL